MDLLEQITHLDWSHGPIAFLESLLAAIGEVVLDIGMVVEAVLAALEGSIITIADVIAELIKITGLDFSDGPVAFIESVWHALEYLFHNALALVLNFPGQLVGGLEQLSAWVLDTVFGIISPDRIPELPISHLINGSVNLLSNPSFTAEPFKPGESGLWVLDPNESQDGEGGAARIDADGGNHNLLSVDLISVSPGQRLEVSGWVKTQNLAGALVTIGLAQYNTDDGSDEPTFLTLMMPTQTGTTTWKKWDGIYVTPLDGVKKVRVHIEVAHATAGSIWFDNMFCGKMGLLQIDWVDGLPAWITSIESLFASIGLQIADFIGIPEMIAELSKITGLVWDKGPIAFAQSVFDAIWHLIQAAITGITVTAEHVAEAVSTGVNGLVDTLLNGATGTAETLGGMINGTSETVQSWIAAITGNRPPVQGPMDSADHLAQLIATTTAQATTIAQLQAQITAPTGGIIGGDDFERKQPNLTPQWAITTTGLGHFELDGHQAVWIKDGFIPGHTVAFRASNQIDYHTKTAAQAITRVTGTYPLESITILDSATDEIYGRVGVDAQNKTSYIRVAIACDHVKLFYNPGTATIGLGDVELAFKPFPGPSPGVTYTLECGNATVDNHYRVLRNGEIVIDYPDTGNLTQALFVNRGWGFGGAANGSLFGQVAPSSLHSISVMDLRKP